MFTFNTSDVQRLAISAIGALLVSTICIVGAVGPAKADAATVIGHHQFLTDGVSQRAAR